VIGLIYKGDSLGYIHNQIAGLIGANAAEAVTGAIRSIRTSEHGTMANVISVIVLFVGASSVFAQLQTTLNRIWGVHPKPDRFWQDLFKQRITSFAMVLGISFVLLVSLLLSAFLSAMTGYFHSFLPGADFIWHLLDVAVSFAVVVLLLGAIYKVVPDVDLGWQDVWIGAVVTAVLFVGGKAAIGFYLGRSGVGSAYGAAGSLLILLAWVYYSSQILFIGAEFTKLHAEVRGVSVQPIEGAKAVTKGAKKRERGEMPKAS
jgi:membrane protein